MPYNHAMTRVSQIGVGRAFCEQRFDVAKSGKRLYSTFIVAIVVSGLRGIVQTNRSTHSAARTLTRAVCL